MSSPPVTYRHHLQPWLLERDSQKPFLVDDGVFRTLHFSPDFVQSEMSIDDPYALTLGYTRTMMAFLLFYPRPKDIVIVGLGGGSLTKFCYRQLPRARITTVEVDAYVIGCRHLFQIPDPGERMRIVHADAADYVATAKDRADVILLDGCDERGIAPAFGNERFYRNLRARLSPGGVLVVNLVGSPEVIDVHERFIEDAFADHVVVVDVRSESNRVAFAFNDPWRPPDWRTIERQAKKLLLRHGLDFPTFARKLQRSFEERAETKMSARDRGL